jgi:hypothetical protein
MVSIKFEYLFGVSAHWRVTGQTISNIIGFFSAFFVDGVAVYGKYLPDKREIKIVVQ